MLFFYIRHGDPIYEPDSLTPLGKRQAEALAKRLSLYGIDKIYASTSERAKMTAMPTCEILKKEMTLLDFCNEKHAWDELSVEINGYRTWAFQHPDLQLLFMEDSVHSLGRQWYDHPQFKQYSLKKGIERITNKMNDFFLSLGYEHINNSGKYRVIKPNNERVALFAHQGFGLTFLSCLLGIPYPQFCTHFDMSHSAMTVIDFYEINGYSIPKVLTLSSDSHIYREGLPTNYNNVLRF